MKATPPPLKRFYIALLFCTCAFSQAQEPMQNGQNTASSATESADSVNSTEMLRYAQNDNVITNTQSSDSRISHIELSSEMSHADSIQKVRLEKSVVKAQVSSSELPIELQSKQISIIESAQLLQDSTGNIQSVLESVPGILYSRSGGINGQITFRGQNSNNQRSIIMIDGVRYSGRSTLEFNTLDPYAFDSVEVLRGAASSLWGSDAQNGVINFRSRISSYNINGDRFKATARIRALEYGSVNNLFGGRAEILGGGGGWDMLIGFSAKTGSDYTTPIKENGSNKAKNSSFNYYGIDLNIGYSKNATRYYVQGRATRVESHRAGGLGAAPGSSYGILMSENPISEYFLRIGAKSHHLSFADSMEAYLYYRHWDTDIWNNRSAFNGANIHQKVYNNNYFGGRLIYNSIFGKHNLSYGAEFESAISPTQVRQINLNTGVTNTTNRPSTSTDFALFVKDDFNATSNWTLSAALRGDYVLTTISKTRSSTENTQIANGNAIAIESARLLDENSVIHNGAITGSLGSVLFFNDYISNVINISHNFKAPGAGSRMSSTPSGSSTLTVANPLIKPEYSQTAEFGFRITSDNHFISLIGFYTYYQDMLTLSSYQNANASGGQVNNRLYRYENVGRAYITGAELEGRHSFFDDRFTIHYVGAYNYGQNLTDKKPIAYLAPLYGQISFALNFHKWYLNFTQRAYAAKTRIDQSEERKTGAYTMSDIYVGLKLGGFSASLQDMQLQLGVNNLFDTVGRNPVTVQSVSHSIALTNPLVEPGRNIFVKYIWNY